jgi:hypothetical protein
MSGVLMAIAWAIVGAVLYKVSSAIIALGRYTVFSRMVLFHSLKLMALIVDEIQFLRGLKYKHMSEVGLEEDQIELIKELDHQALGNWKENAIALIIGSFPGPLRNIVTFNNWKEAMKELDKFYRTN